MLTGEKSPLRLAVLTTHRAPGLRALLAPSPQFRVVGVIATEPASSAVVETAGTGVPCVVHDFQEFHRSLAARPTDMTIRPFYDFETSELLAPWKPDLVILLGYLHILTDPVLVRYRDRILNVHDSDLLLREPDGRPHYRGLHSTRDAIFAGESETRSTLHLVTRDVDVGPPLVRSWSFPVDEMVSDGRRLGATDLLRAYAYAQREWMMRTAWGPLLVHAIARFARDEVRIISGRAHLDGIPGPITLERPAVPAPAAPVGAPG